MHGCLQREIYQTLQEPKQKMPVDTCMSSHSSLVTNSTRLCATYNAHRQVSASITCNYDICKLMYLTSMQSRPIPRLKKKFQLATAAQQYITFMLLKDRNSKLPVHILQHFFPTGRVMNSFLPGVESAQKQE